MGREMVAQPAKQFHRALPFGRAERGSGPLGAVGIVERNESRLAAHGQPHIAGFQIVRPPRWPSVSISCHWASVYGLVTRGVS